MKARLATAAVLACLILGCGVIAIATIGAALDDRAHSREPRFNATARCEDGTWSWSKDPEAPEACGNHGGVEMSVR